MASTGGPHVRESEPRPDGPGAHVGQTEEPGGGGEPSWAPMASPSLSLEWTPSSSFPVTTEIKLTLILKSQFQSSFQRWPLQNLPETSPLLSNLQICYELSVAVSSSMLCPALGQETVSMCSSSRGYHSCRWDVEFVHLEKRHKTPHFLFRWMLLRTTGHGSLRDENTESARV